MLGAEVGVAEGRFSRELLDAGLEMLYLIDIWERVPFIRGCASFEDKWHTDNHEMVKTSLSKEIESGKAVLLKGFSYKMADYIPDESLGLVYLDGDHLYEGVRSDINSFLPKLVKGGILAFHDYANPDYGVRQAVDDFTKGGHGVQMIEEDGSIENVGAYIIKQ
jgi:hypothetical protein